MRHFGFELLVQVSVELVMMILGCLWGMIGASHLSCCCYLLDLAPWIVGAC